MENAERRVGYSCTGGPPWPPLTTREQGFERGYRKVLRLIAREQRFERGAVTEDRPYRSTLLAAGFVLTWMLLTCSPSVFALNPSLDISQYAHTSWKIRDGFSRGRIGSIAQTPDGYLWLGTDLGLLRFDGVKSVPFQPPPDQHLPSNTIFSLLAARDGTLWIGTDKGLASWNGSILKQYPEFAGQFVFALLEDHEGTVWAGTYGFNLFSTGKLCAINGGSIQCFGEDGALGRGVFNLYEDKKGNLWASVQNGLWRWRPGTPAFLAVPTVSGGRESLAEDSNGALLMILDGAIRRLVDGKTEAYPLPDPVRKFRCNKMFHDRDGGLWIGTSNGLLHVHQGKTDVFLSSDGLSADEIASIFEDREGNIWIATQGGLDRFREFAIPRFTVKEGLSNASVVSVLAVRDGSVLFATIGGLNRWINGQLTVHDKNTPSAERIKNAPYSLFQDARGRIWTATLREFGYLENDRLIPVKGM